LACILHHYGPERHWNVDNISAKHVGVSMGALRRQCTQCPFGVPTWAKINSQSAASGNVSRNVTCICEQLLAPTLKWVLIKYKTTETTRYAALRLTHIATSPCVMRATTPTRRHIPFGVFLSCKSVRARAALNLLVDPCCSHWLPLRQLRGIKPQCNLCLGGLHDKHDRTE
jgi:hypothetical protein